MPPKVTLTAIKHLFAPTVWLSGRLSFSGKYLLIGVIVLITLVTLSRPFLQRAHDDTQLAELERKGLRAFTKQADTLVFMVQRRSEAIHKTTPTVSDRVSAGVAQIVESAIRAGLTSEAEPLQRSWQDVQSNPSQSDPQRRFATRTAAINALLRVIQASARHYRLNVDSDLDAAFDMLSGRLPLVLETLGKQRDALSLEIAEMASYAFGAQVILTESVPALKTGVAQLVAQRRDAASLRQELSRLLSGIVHQQDTADRALNDPQATQELQGLSRDNLSRAQQLLNQTVVQADAYLVMRIAHLQRAQRGIAAILIGSVAAIAYLFAGVYLSTLRSLKSLSEGTAAFCRGDLETRISIDTRDELVLVAGNFNTVAIEFGRLLDVIREQNESRQRELETLVHARTTELADSNAQLRAAGERVQEELNLARNMQAAILPQHFPDERTWSVYAGMFPARELGGDFYDCIPLGDGRYGLVIADVSGKGVGAAFFMAVSRTVLLDIASSGQSPAVVLARVNDLLCERNPMELFITACYAIYDPTDGQVVYASAGHELPLLREACGTVRSLECQCDLALAVVPGLDYGEQVLQLNEGDALLFYTDGVTEAFSDNGEAYGEGRLSAWFSRSAPECNAAALLNGLVRNVATFVDGAEASDDLTCMVLCRKPSARSHTDLDKLLPKLGDKTLIFEHSVPSRVDEIPTLADKVEIALSERGDLAFVVNLCLEELISNTIQYGLNGDPERLIHVRLSSSDEWLEILLKDDAPPFDPFSDAPLPNLLLGVDERPVGGLGVHLVKEMMDEARAYYDGSGNLIVLLKALNRQQADGCSSQPDNLSIRTLD